jgi:rhodanese-related sulfurtransferase
MRFLIDNWILVLAAVTSGALLLWPSLSRGGRSGAVSVAEAVRLMNREKAVLIDVCEPAEYAAGHAAGAKNVPVGSIDTSKVLPADKQTPLVLVCASGARAHRAAGKLRHLGFQNAHVLAGGLPAWREANLPVEKDNRAAG